MVDHLEHRAVDPERVEREQADVISPICASDEYAITPRMSGERKASSEPYTSPTPASTRITVVSLAGPGNFAIAIRSKPYAATFEITPESRPATSGEDSR